MALNFNVSPYYDDFSDTKNFHRILFKPGSAVQARELTQSQTILQDQITKFADNIFKQNSPVTGGQVTTDFGVFYVKLQDTYDGATIDVTQFTGLLVQDATGTVIARVVGTASSTSGDPNTLVLSYLSGNHFADGDVIYDTESNLAAQTITSGSTGASSIASISKGVFYVLGNFVQVEDSTIVLNKYDNTPTVRLGLTITETIVDYVDDPTLLDPAVGASNYQAPGADRYLISLSLDTRPIEFGDDDDFIELVRIVDGEVQKMVDGSVYNVIDDYFAKRDYETNGDYIVNDFKLTPRTNANTELYTLSVGKGLAYVHGYRTDVPNNVDLVSPRARTTDSENNTPVYTDYGSYMYVDHVRGTSGAFFDTTTAQSIDIHCVTSANVNSSSSTTYNSTVVASGYIRNFVYDHNTSDSDANTYVYKAFVNDLQNAVATGNVISSTSNTITLPSTFSAANGAYVGVNVSLTNGPSSGDFRTITAYNGSSKVATVNQNWTSTPTTATVFALNFEIKDSESIIYRDSSTYAVKSSAAVSTYGKSGGLTTGNAVLQNPNNPSLIFRVGSPYVASISDCSYTTQQLNRNLNFTYAGGAATAQLNYEGSYVDILQHFGTPGSYLSSDLAKQNYLVVVTNKGSSIFNNGDIVSFADTATRTILLDDDASIATLSVTDAGGTFTATVLEKVYARNGTNTSYILKYKNLVTANTSGINYGTAVTGNSDVYVNDTSITSTGQVYVTNAGLVTPGQKQSLYLSDVKRIVKIIDTKSSGTTPTVSMLSDATYDVTNHYTFDNGQRDSYYDHASITLKPGAPQPAGNLLVLVDYYQHAGGQGYFSLSSYIESSLQETYANIPSYTSKNGAVYSLRDCLDFRPSRQNGTTTFQYEYDDVGDGRYGAFIPSDSTTFVCDYEYYLGRKDKLVLTKDGQFSIVQGSPSLNPLLPSEPDGSLVVANLIHDPYTAYIPTESPVGVQSNLSIEKVKHKRYTMQDIAGLESRINQIEYYTSLSLLEQKASSLQITDAYGLNRFKNGILVDDFSSFYAADTYNNDYNASINRRQRVMSAPQSVTNLPLKSTALINNMDRIDPSIDLGYKIDSDGFVHYFSLPYTTANVVSQKYASRTVNLNPFSYIQKDGILALTPNMDNWVDTEYEPALLIVDPNLQVWRANTGVSTLMAQTDWMAIPGTTYTNTQSGRNWVATQTYQNQSQTSWYGPYDNIGNTYAINNGYITDISILPYIRPQEIVVRAKNMLVHTNIDAYFDNTNVNQYLRKGNIIELSSSSGNFQENDVIGYYTSGKFYPTGRVLGVYKYPGTTNVRLYVAGDATASTYDGATGSIRNAYFNASGVYSSTSASGVVRSTSHYGNVVRNANTTTSLLKLSPLASNTNNYYVSNTIYITSGSAQGQSATIQAYYGANQTALLSSSIAASNNDIYSIGSLKTDDHGESYGVFCLPPNRFHNGERVFRVDNSNGNLGAETTYAQSTFFAQGLQTTAQALDFGASPAGAAGVSSTSATRTVQIASSYRSWDPLAQTFLVEKNNYPNGLFLKSIKVNFATKPRTDNSPVSLWIVSTLNGYPTTDILQHSVVTLTPEQVNTSSSPQYLDSTTSTTFTFSVPVYIQPGVMYAFILKSLSNEYTVYTAYNGDNAIASSVRNLPTDPTPSTISKIAGSPYVGTLFMSQNSQTWTADQNQSMMFTMDRCVFSTSANPSIQFAVPKKLPQRSLIESSIAYANNANLVSSTTDSVSNTNILVDAFNITTTDFTPTSTGITYSYNATLTNGSAAGSTIVVPGKFGIPTPDNIYLADGKGERELNANSSTSFLLNALISTTDNAVSPVISDAGLSTYALSWDINNAELSNNMITLASGGSSYDVSNTTIEVSAPDLIGGEQAYAAANISGGIVRSVWLTSNGSGYITTPTITITDSSSSGSGASVVVVGETSPNGGNITTKYITKTVTLDAGFDSGDINVFLSAYRPVNTDINVYYKILNRNDTQKFEDGNWQLMTKTRSSDSKYSQSRTDVIEYTYAPGTENADQGFVTYTSTNGQTYTTFSQFAIKVVLTTSDKTFTPFLTDIRAIALPPNVNTAF